MAFVLGVDIGGTGIKLALIGRSGVIAARRSVSTPARITPRQLVRLLRAQCDRLRGGRAVEAVGVGVPGLVDAETGEIHTLVNIHGWRHVPLQRLLRREFGLPAIVENDVNVMALAEARFGAGKGAKSLFCLTLGTGVGGGMVWEGRLYRGVTFSAGEIGHMPIYPDGPPCGCGGWGCLEQYVGNRRIVERAAERIRAGARTSVKVTGLTPAVLTRAAERGDRMARQLWRDVAKDLAVALVAVVNVYNPDRIVIGGGVAQAGRWLFAPLRRAVRARAMVLPAQAVSILPARLGPDAGVLGAAALARDMLANVS